MFKKIMLIGLIAISPLSFAKTITIFNYTDYSFTLQSYEQDIGKSNSHCITGNSIGNGAPLLPQSKYILKDDFSSSTDCASSYIAQTITYNTIINNKKLDSVESIYFCDKNSLKNSVCTVEDPSSYPFTYIGILTNVTNIYVSITSDGKDNIYVRSKI